MVIGHSLSLTQPILGQGRDHETTLLEKFGTELESSEWGEKYDL
jgi:hypothetical protein